MTPEANVAVVGIGTYPFGRHPGLGGLAMGAEAVRRALTDARLDWQDIQFAFGGSSDGGKADTMVTELGPTGIPFTNVSNGCATGGSALVSAYHAIESGAYEVGVVVGFDKHPRGAFMERPEEWSLPTWYGAAGMMVTTQFFGIKIQRYMHDYGIEPLTLAQVAEKAFQNGELNPNAWRRKPWSAQQILDAPMVSDPLTQYMLCSPGEGAAALVVCHTSYAKRLGARPVYVRAVGVRTRTSGSFEVYSPAIGVDLPQSPSVGAASTAMEMAGIGPRDVDVVQVQDTEAGAEIIHLAECGLCEPGEQPAMYASGATQIGGRLPVNTDGGCIANGEPIGASGLRQVHEIVLQLRGEAGPRQVPGHPRLGFTHVYGAPGVSACAVLSR
jgi:acetyl-CoA acetyltransferase